MEDLSKDLAVAEMHLMDKMAMYVQLVPTG